jgi:DNA repair exonuclease SbcCD ATPase subunit
MLTLQQYQEKLQQALGEKRRLENQLQKAREDLEQAEEDLQTIEKAQAFIQKIAQETQNQLSYRVEDIVQMGIDTCFPGDFQFRLKFETKRGKTEASLDLIQEGWSIDPLASCGGGVSSIEAFGLRIASWSLERTNNTIWLDEPFKDINGEHIRQAACEVLKQVSHQLGIQFIIITGDQEIVNVADRVFDVRIRKGVSHVTVSDKER